MFLKKYKIKHDPNFNTDHETKLSETARFNSIPPNLMDIKDSLSSLWKSATQWVGDQPKVAIPVITAAGLFVAATAYKLTLGDSDEEEATNWDYVLARRIQMAKTKINCPDGITIEEEYVQMPDGNVLFTRCYIPKKVEIKIFFYWISKVTFVHALPFV